MNAANGLRPFRVAVVGAGPAGLYLADQLTYESEIATVVDLFERLPVPFGLLRYGVAPDHPTIKSAAETFQEILDRPQVNLYCNVQVGRDILVAELRERYDAVVYANGADTDRRLGIEGEGLPGSISATDFVKWYNGHPEASAHDLRGAKSVVVIGAGNVALDVARILVKDAKLLTDTDIPSDVLNTLGASSVTDVHIVARRGPEFARFTTKEVRELGGLDGVDVIVDPEEIPAEDPDGLGPVGRRNLGVLRGWATKQATGAPRRVHLHFGARPERLLGDATVRGIRVATARGSVDVDAHLVIRAIGYRSQPIDGVSFDEESGTIPHQDHRVRYGDGGGPVEYAVGWVKRGPSGILGTNRGDAADTAAAIRADFGGASKVSPSSTMGDVFTERGVVFLGKESWSRIVRHERALGADCGRGRVKIQDWQTLVDIGRAVGENSGVVPEYSSSRG
jgi:ferredoxin--NADP+ reductase